MTDHFISRQEAESDLLSCATFLGESIETADGHAESMLAVVPRYLAKGNVDLAAELANTVDDPFSRDKLLIAVSIKCAEIDDDEYALQLIDALDDHGLQAEGWERLGALKAAMGQFDAARKIAGEMEHPDYVLSAIAIRQFADDDPDGAKSTIREIEFPAARVSAFIHTAHARIALGETEGIEDLLEPAIADAAEIEHDEEKIRAVIEIGTLFSDAGQNGRAIETFDKAREYSEELDNIHRDAFFAAVSVGFLRAGSQDLADRTLDLVTDKTQIASCLLGHARLYWSNDAKDDAMESLEEAYAMLRSQRENETRSSKDRFRLFGSIATQYVLFGKGERAIEIAEQIEDDNESMTALAQVAALLADSGSDELARRAVNAIPEDANRTFALIGMSDAKAGTEQKEAAVELLDEAMHLAETVPQLSSRASAYNEIAARFAKLEDDARLETAIHGSFESIAALRDDSIKAASLAELSAIADELELAPGENEIAYLRKFVADVSKN